MEHVQAATLEVVRTGQEHLAGRFRVQIGDAGAVGHHRDGGLFHHPVEDLAKSLEISQRVLFRRLARDVGDEDWKRGFVGSGMVLNERKGIRLGFCGSGLLKQLPGTF